MANVRYNEHRTKFRRALTLPDSNFLNFILNGFPWKLCDAVILTSSLLQSCVRGLKEHASVLNVTQEYFVYNNTSLETAFRPCYSSNFASIFLAIIKITVKFGKKTNVTRSSYIRFNLRSNIFVINNIKYEWKYSQSNLDPTNFLHSELDFIFLVDKVTSHPIPTILRATNKTVSWRVGTFVRFQKIHRKPSNRKRLPVLHHTWKQESLRLLKRITKAIGTDARWKKEKKKEKYGKERESGRWMTTRSKHFYRI